MTDLEKLAGKAVGLCFDCPPENYPTDKTRCLPCPNRRMRMDFETWLKRIDQLANDHGVPKSYVGMTGKECWKEMYDEGYSPEDAWGEEVYAASTMG